MANPNDPALDRRHVVKSLLANRGELLVVAGLGASAWDVTAAGDHPLNFPLWGGMGGAATIGLGLAMARHVVKAHRGAVRLDSGEGEGACFTVDLPLIPSEQALEVPEG